MSLPKLSKRFYLDRDTIKHLKEEAKRTGDSQAAVVRKALREYFDNQGDE